MGNTLSQIKWNLWFYRDKYIDTKGIAWEGKCMDQIARVYVEESMEDRVALPEEGAVERQVRLR